MTRKHGLPVGARYSLIGPDESIVGGVYATPGEVLKWARRLPYGAPPVEFVTIDPDAPESVANLGATVTVILNTSP